MRITKTGKSTFRVATKPENFNWLVSEQEKTGLSISALLDRLITEKRNNKND